MKTTWKTNLTGDRPMANQNEDEFQDFTSKPYKIGSAELPQGSYDRAMREKTKPLPGQVKFSSGSTRSGDADAYRYDLIPAVAMKRIAKVFADGGKVHGDRNWERGQPVDVVLNHGIRHLIEWMAGCRKEDHLAKMAWAMLAVMYYEEHGIDLDETMQYFKPRVANQQNFKSGTEAYNYDLKQKNKLSGAGGTEPNITWEGGRTPEKKAKVAIDGAKAAREFKPGIS